MNNLTTVLLWLVIGAVVVEVAIMLLYLVMVARKTDDLKHDPKRYRKY
jgi:multisubunit Na+/H+ antiporter MnhC subunit